MPMIKYAIFAAAALLSACATSNATYAPAASPGGRGYSETQVETGRYFVTYRASRAQEPQLLEDYALLRAAELTLENNRDWFWVDRRTLDEQASGRASGPSIGIGIGGGSWGRSSGGSVGVGVNVPLGGGGSTQRASAATLEVRFGQGAKPDEPNAYDARSVAANLRPRLANR